MSSGLMRDTTEELRAGMLALAAVTAPMAGLPLLLRERR